MTKIHVLTNIHIRRNDCESPNCFRVLLCYLRIILNLNYFCHNWNYCLHVTILCYSASTVQMLRPLVMEITNIQDFWADIVRAEKIKILALLKLAKYCQGLNLAAYKHPLSPRPQICHSRCISGWCWYYRCSNENDEIHGTRYPSNFYWYSR